MNDGRIGMSLTKFLLEEQRSFSASTGDFTGLFSALVFACKIIAREVNKAGLVNILGKAGRINIQGEEVEKLDEFANSTIINTMEHGGHLAGDGGYSGNTRTLPQGQIPAALRPA
jgi:fructose-1,6-bisphosphatase I